MNNEENKPVRPAGAPAGEARTRDLAVALALGERRDAVEQDDVAVALVEGRRVNWCALLFGSCYYAWRRCYWYAAVWWLAGFLGSVASRVLGALAWTPLVLALGSLPGPASVWLAAAATVVLGNLIPVAVWVAQGLLFYPIYRSHARSLAERARQGGRATEEEQAAYVRQHGGTSYAALAVCIALELVATALLAPVL